MTAKESKEKDQIEEKASLRNLFEKYGIKTIYTVCKHVSQSGMYRVLDLYIATGPDDIRRITYSVAKACDHRYDRKHEGLGVSGCGMDMGFSIVYDLSVTLYGRENRADYRLSQRWI